MGLKKAFYAALPKKRMGAGVLFRDQENHILLVQPSYKPTWEIPGGIVESNESPWQCCHREVQEEIGLVKTIGRLLVVEYNPPTGDKTESLMFIFDGGVLLPEEIGRIRLQSSELLDYAFFAVDHLPESLTETLRRRITAAWHEMQTGRGVYLEDGFVLESD